MRYNRNNQTYRMLMGICYLVIHGLLQTEDNGIHRFMDFDEEDKAWLFENFVLEYFKKEYPEIKVSAPFINWQLNSETDIFLPVMRTDIVLEHKNNMLIIDTKYYKNILKKRYGKRNILSANMYQIYSYVKNKEVELRDNSHELSGMLLYAKTDEEIIPKAEYDMHGNRIYIRTLNLDQDFTLIEEELNNIANIVLIEYNLDF